MEITEEDKKKKEKRNDFMTPFYWPAVEAAKPMRAAMVT